MYTLHIGASATCDKANAGKFPKTHPPARHIPQKYLSLMMFAPVTMKVVCQMPRPILGMMPWKRPFTPFSLTIIFITPVMLRADWPALARACISVWSGEVTVREQGSTHVRVGVWVICARGCVGRDVSGTHDALEEALHTILLDNHLHHPGHAESRLARARTRLHLCSVIGRGDA